MSQLLSFIKQRVGSLQFKLLALPVVVVLFFIWSSTYFAGRYIYERQQDFVQAQQSSMAVVNAEVISQKVGERIKTLESLAAKLDAKQLGDRKYAQSYLDNRYSLYVSFPAGAILLNKDGVAVADTPTVKGRLGSSYADREYFQQAKATRKTVVSQPLLARVLKQVVVTFATPLFDAQGEFAGALVGALSISSSDFLGLLISPKAMASNEFYLESLQLRMTIASSDPSRVMVPLVDNDFSRQLLAGKTNFLAKNRLGIEKIYAVAPVEHTDWKLVIALPSSVAFAPADALRVALITIALLCSVIGVALAVPVSNRLIAPLARVARDMDAMTNARTELAPVPEHGDAEVRSLIASFNRLVLHIQGQNRLLAQERKELLAAQTGLSTLNEALELKVEQRTQDMQDLYRFLQEVVERLPFGLLVFDGSHRVVLHNKLLSELLNLPTDFFAQGEVFHTTLIRFKHARGDFGDQKLDDIIQAYADGLDSRQPLRIERFYTNGRSFEVLGQPLLDDHMVVIYTDTTALKESERALLAAKEQAEAATVSKSQFLANMSHEIRTPMNGILGLAHVLEKMPLGREERGLVRRIEQTGRTLQSILNDILDFSKIEASQLSLERVPFTVAEVLDSVANIMAADPARAQVDMAISPPPSRLPALLGDSLRLGQVLTNLVGNAIKFTHRGFVRLEVQKIAEDEASTTLRFAVRDSGIGISDSVMAEIFKPFSQADASTTRKYGGTGLGLSISRKLIEMMGGTLEVVSNPGEGSEFSFTLTFPVAPSSNDLCRSLQSIELLIADDSDISREALKSTALSLGWSPTVVDGGEAVLRHVTMRRDLGLQPEILLLDWDMPDLDGLAVAKAVNQELSGGQGPIIILATAHTKASVLALPDSVLVDCVISKPVSASALFDAVVTAMTRRGKLQDQALAQGASRLQGVRMLVVDDSDVNREVARLIFEGEGATVTLANDGQESVDWLGAHPGQIDLVLMDVQMPILSGIDATRCLRADPRFATLPIVALSAGAFAQDRAAAMAAGMDDHITKPMDVDKAVNTILAYLRKAHWVPPPGAPGLAPLLPVPVADQPRYPGLDADGAIRLWRSADVYQGFLRKFAGDYSAALADLASQAPAPRAALVHKHAGASGSLGMPELAQACRDYDSAWREGADVQPAMAALLHAKDTAWQSIRQYLQA